MRRSGGLKDHVQQTSELPSILVAKNAIGAQSVQYELQVPSPSSGLCAAPRVVSFSRSSRRLDFRPRTEGPVPRLLI